MMAHALILAQVTWQSPQLAPTAVGLAAVVAAAVLWLYPPQTHGLPRLWRWTMPALRALAAGALAVAVVQPIVLRPRTTARQGAILLLVDRSRSMSVVDRGRSPAELVALAGGLGVLPPGAREEAAPGLRGRLDGVRSLLDQLSRARSEADYADLSGRGVPAANARVREAAERLRAGVFELPLPSPPLDRAELGREIAQLKQLPPALNEPAIRRVRGNLDRTAIALARAQAELDEAVFNRNPYVRDAATRLGRMSRAELIQAGFSVRGNATADGGGGLLGDIANLAPAFAFAFDGDVTPLPVASTWEEPAPELSPTGSSTDLAGALRGAMQRMGTRAVQAMVVISDGRQTGADAQGVAGDVAAAGVPVFAVAASAPAPTRDLAIVAVDAPASARVGQSIPVRAHLRGGPAYRGVPVTVRLDAGSARRLRDVTLNDDGEGVAEFEVTLSDAGPLDLVLDASPQVRGPQAEEATGENNRFVHTLRVGAEPARVTVLVGASAAGLQQYGTLHHTLSRAQWVRLLEVDEEEIPALSPRAILAQDVVILLDVPGEAVSRAQWQALERLVRRRGGSVIVCSGENAPLDYVDDPLIARLLPFGDAPKPSWRTWPGGEPHFRVAPPPAGGDGEFDADEFDRRAPEAWRQLAPLSRFIPAPPPGASARALLVERESGAAVVTETHRGLGRTYFIGTDQTWRWRSTPGSSDEPSRAPRDPFWPRLIRLAAGEPFAAMAGNIALDADDVVPEPRQPVTVRARVFDAYGDPVEEATQTLEIRRVGEGQFVRNVTLASLGAGSGLYRAQIADLEAGEYLLRVEAPEDPFAEIPPDPVTLPLRVEPLYEEEMADVSGDEPLLRRIASASGGQFLTLEQLASLPARLDAVRQRQSRLVEYNLWDSPYLFVFVLACLSAEWALRKKFALA